MKTFFAKVSASQLFVCTLLCLPGVLFQQSVVFLWADVLLFMLLNALKKGHIRLLPALIILISVVFFNLLAPSGLVLFSVFSFKVTQGALFTGLRKSGILLGMVFISQYAVSRTLYLPGRFGGFLSLVFWYFDKLSEKDKSAPAAVKSKLKKTFSFAAVRALFEKIDNKLLSVFYLPPAERAGTQSIQSARSTHSESTVPSHSLKYALFSALPLFPVYALLILYVLGFFPA